MDREPPIAIILPDGQVVTLTPDSDVWQSNRLIGSIGWLETVYTPR